MFVPPVPICLGAAKAMASAPFPLSALSSLPQGNPLPPLIQKQQVCGTQAFRVMTGPGGCCPWEGWASLLTQREGMGGGPILTIKDLTLPQPK